MKILRKLWPFFFIIIVWVVLFWPFFSKKLLPIPSDIVSGMYFPWLDYKWGYSVGVPVKNPLLSDIPSLLYPWRSFAVDEMKAGRWPLWNPYYFTGMPLLANFQSAVFSYANIFFLFLPKAIAWSIGVIVSPLLTLLAVYLFLRHKGLEKLSSLLGGIVFSLSGFQIAWMEYNVHGHTALFLPLILITIDKIFSGKNKYWLILLPVLIALQIFSGYIPVVIYSYIICFIYILFFYFVPQFRQKSTRLKLMFLGIFWMLGILLAGIQLLPGYELTKNSIRGNDQTVSASNASYLPLKNLVTFISPDFFGNPATGNYFGNAFYDNFYLFIGTGTLIFIFYSLFFVKRRKEIVFWWLITLLSVILIFKNPLGIFLEKILFLSGGVSSRALFITDFSLSIIAAYGFNLFLNHNLKERKKIFFALGMIFFLVFLCLKIAFLSENPFRLVSFRNLAVPIAAILLCSMNLLFVVKNPKIFAGKLLLLIIISSQLLYSAKKYLPFTKEELLFPKTPTIEFLQTKNSESMDPFRIELGKVIPQNFLMPYGLQTTSGYDALLPKRTAEFLSVLQIKEIDKRLSRVWLVENFDSPLYPLLNTKYVLVKKINREGYFTSDGNSLYQFDPKGRFEKVFEDKTVLVFQDSMYLPRVSLIYDQLIADAPSKMLSLMNSPIDYSESVILEEPVTINGKGTGKIEWKYNFPAKMGLAIETDKPAILFIAENYFPGWEASVNSKETKILRANYTFKAVAIPSGKSEIILNYQPMSFILGTRVSLISLTVLILMGISFSVKRKNKITR